MNYKDTDCSCCRKNFKKETRRYNEAIKFGWNFYCSLQCQYKTRTTQKEFNCANPLCNKLIKRRPKEVSSSTKVFCSYSCSAKVNNRIRESNRTKKHCANENCDKEIKSRNKYCSIKCQWIINSVTNEEYREIITDKIKEFYKANGRIPFKHEMWGIHKQTRKIFRTWNNAIIATGFKPNPVKFSNKCIAKDGHKCDSLAEKIIDDWLFIRKIKHETKIPYNYRRMTADFKINDTYVEFFGLQGQVKSYDRLVMEKEALWREKNLKVIKIYPNDLFPKNQLDKIFAKITL